MDYVVDFSVPAARAPAAMYEFRRDFGVNASSGVHTFHDWATAYSFIAAVKRWNGTAAIREDLSMHDPKVRAGATQRHAEYLRQCARCRGTGAVDVQKTATSFSVDQPPIPTESVMCPRCAGTGVVRGVAATPADMDKYWSEARSDQPGELRALMDRLVRASVQDAPATPRVGFWVLKDASSRFEEAVLGSDEERITRYRWLLRTDGELALETLTEVTVLRAGKIMHRDPGTWAATGLPDLDHFLVGLDFDAWAEHGATRGITEPVEASIVMKYGGSGSLTRNYAKGRGLVEELQKLVSGGIAPTYDTPPHPDQAASVTARNASRRKRAITFRVVGGLVVGVVWGLLSAAIGRSSAVDPANYGHGPAVFMICVVTGTLVGAILAMLHGRRGR